MSDENNKTVTDEVVEETLTPLVNPDQVAVDEDAALDAILAGEPVPEPSAAEDNSPAELLVKDDSD